MLPTLSLRAVALVAFGGALGCVLRYVAAVWLARPDFPLATLLVNLVGSFAIGVVMFGPIAHGVWGDDARLLLVTGLLGGFTTMSSFAFETSALAGEGAFGQASLYLAVTIVGSLVAAWVGAQAGVALAHALGMRG